MAQTGQDVALVVRPNVQKKGEKRNHNRDATSYAPFELVNGFRRYAAGLVLNEDPKEQEQSKKTGRSIIPNVPNGCMRVVVRNLDDLQAKLLNGRENVRSPLEPPDLMAHISSLNRPPYTMSVGEIAENQGLSLSTVHKYANVGGALDTEVFKHWRFGGAFTAKPGEAPVTVGKRVSFDDIETVSKLAKGDQGAAYKALLLGKVEDAQSKDWYVAAQKAAYASRAPSWRDSRRRGSSASPRSRGRSAPHTSSRCPQKWVRRPRRRSGSAWPTPTRRN